MKLRTVVKIEARLKGIEKQIDLLRLELFDFFLESEEGRDLIEKQKAEENKAL